MRALCIVLAGASAAVAAPAAPPGFQLEEVAPSGTWDVIVGIAIPGDGRIFVAEKRGAVHVIDNNVKPAAPALDLELEVLNDGDRGLLGIAVDPSFAANGYLYLLYTVDPDVDGIDAGAAFGRLTRYTVVSRSPTTIDPASRRVLLGQGWADGIPSLADTHTIGCLRFGLDGSLLVSTGDGGHPSGGVDAGSRDPGAFGPGKIPPAEDIGDFRSQWLGSLAGKILRLDPRNGLGLPDNPYSTGSAADNASRVWAYGLRNPFRFAVEPGSAASGPGRLAIGDVGWNTWEELNRSTAGGENFGWPCHEGPYPEPLHQAAFPAHHGCASIGTPANPALPRAPTFTWHHTNAALSQPAGTIGNASSAVAFYSGTNYPAEYRGACFFGDYGGGWIKVAQLDESPLHWHDFITGADGPSDLVADPVSGDLFFVAVQRTRIWRLRYDVLNRAPAAAIDASVLTGDAPLAVQLSSARSSDPDGDTLTYQWSFGDGQLSQEESPLHVYPLPGTYTVSLTVEDGRGGQASAHVEIVVTGSVPGNQRPTVSVVAPLDQGSFLPLSWIVLRGLASDAEDSVGQLDVTWEVVLHHNNHVHPNWIVLHGLAASFFAGEHDPGGETWYEIILRARDRGGLTGVARTSIYPPATPLILDNRSPAVRTTGSWPLSGALRPYGADSVYSKSLGDTFRYELSLPRRDSYKVYAWWTVYSSRTRSAPYTISRAGGVTTLFVDQTLGANQWNLLGTFDLETAAAVTVTAVGGTLSTCADAVCVIPAQREVTGPLAFIDSISPSPAAPGEAVAFSGHATGVSGEARLAWSSSLDGPLSTQAAFVTSSLSTGTHRLTLLVTDAQGVTSPPAERTLEVRVPTAVNEAILDDGKPGTSSSGSWIASGGARPFGAGSLYSKDTGALYHYDLDLVTPGEFDVYAWWTEIASRGSAIPYVIATAAGNVTLTVDQRSNGGKWNLLGRYALGASTRVSVRSVGGALSTCADAVRVVRAGTAQPPPVQIILDDGEPGTQAVGPWKLSGGEFPFGTQALFSKSAGSYSFVLTPPRPGRYEVLAWWTTAKNRSPTVPYTVEHAAGSTTLQLDQRVRGGQWNSLGAFDLGSTVTVRIASRADGWSYCADAVCVREAAP